ncbi:MAG: iron ABC transporter permease [Methylocystaceae bacterium]|nr:iron ABC transporter permease [Methylocystaceae bacterium]
MASEADVTQQAKRLTNYGQAAGLTGSFFGMSPVVLVLIGLLLCIMLPPIIFLISSSLYTTNPDGSFRDFTFKFYTDLIANPRFGKNLLNTSIYAVGSACVAIFLGGLQAWIVERTNTPLRQYVFLISTISLGIPSVLYTAAFLLLLGKTGPVNQIADALFGINQAVNVYSMWGMIIIEGIDFAPLAFLLLAAVFRSMDASFEEAAIMSGAAGWQTFRRVTLMLAIPGISALFILIFIRAFESFETPALVGRPAGIPLLTTDIYRATQVDSPPNYGQAGAYSVALLFIVAILLAIYNRIAKQAERFQTITGKGFRPRLLNLGGWRYVTSAILVLLFFIIVVFPIAILLWASFLPFYQPFSMKALGFLTLENYRGLISAELLRTTLVNTMILGLSTASLVSLITALFAWLSVRRYRGAWILDQLATTPLIFPSIVLGVALLQIFLASPLPIYGTMASLIYASSMRYLPYGMRYSYAGMLQIHTDLEEAGAISGAGKIKVFYRIVAPLLAPALITCWLYVFLSATKSVSLLILLAGPDTRVVAITIFDLWADGSLTKLAAMGMSWTLFMAIISGGFYMIARRYGVSVR